MVPPIPAWLAEILAKPACDIPEAGRAFGLARGPSYAAAARGDMPTISFGRRKKVPTAWIRQKLGLEPAEPTMRRTIAVSARP